MAGTVSLCACFTLPAAAFGQTEYQAWIRTYTTLPPQASFSTHDEPDPSGVMLKTAAMEGDTPKPPGNFPRLREFAIRYGNAISQRGTVSYYQDDLMGTKGACCGHLSNADLGKLGDLLANLPDDHGRLPPPDRRLVLQVPRAGSVLARVYDRANPSNAVLEILRLIGSCIGTYVLNVKPKDEWKAGEWDRSGALIGSADGKQIISSGRDGPIQFWDADSHALLREVPILHNSPGCSYPMVNGIVMSPNSAVAVVMSAYEVAVFDPRTWQCFHQFPEPFLDDRLRHFSGPVFMPDGELLLMQSDEPALRVVDTRTWQEQPRPPAVPESSVAYYPSPDGSQAVTASAGGEVRLWDPAGKRTGAVATCAAESMACRIRIWETNSGQLERKLWPFEVRASSVDSLDWWVDGQHLIAATKTGLALNHGDGISVWSMETGRHRAELLGCGQNSQGVGLLAGGGLAERSRDGKIRVWNLASVIAQIDQWEKELF